jgi:hypothetical protein
MMEFLKPPQGETQKEPVQAKEFLPPAETEAEKEQRRVKELLGDAITSSTIHGIAGIYSVQSKALKIILTLFFLLSACYCSYQLYIVICNFASFSVVSTNSFSHEIPAEFPGEST